MFKSEHACDLLSILSTSRVCRNTLRRLGSLWKTSNELLSTPSTPRNCSVWKTNKIHVPTNWKVVDNWPMIWFGFNHPVFVDQMLQSSDINCGGHSDLILKINLLETLTRVPSLIDPLIKIILSQYKAYLWHFQSIYATWRLLLQTARPMWHFRSLAWKSPSQGKGPRPVTYYVQHTSPQTSNIITCASSMHITGRVPWGERGWSNRTFFT